MACKEIRDVVWPHPATDSLMRMFNGYRSTLAITPACELGLFDKVAAHPGGVSAQQLADEHSWHADNTGRLMDTMAAHDLLDKRHNADGTAIYQNTESGTYLLSDTKGSFEVIFTKFAKMLMTCMSGLAEEVRTGTKSGKPHWTLPDKEKHKHCKDEVPEPSRDKEHSHGHDDQHGHGANVKGNYMYDVMEATMLPHENELVTAFDLKEYKTAVDIGGGTGLLSYALSRNYPDMKITVVEMTSVVKCAKDRYRPGDFEQLKVDFLEGNCFELDLPTADLYVMSKIMHHFSEEKMDELLTKLYNKLPNGGSVMLVEAIFNDEKTGTRQAHCFDMMLMARGIGKHRSVAEYTAILERNNFRTIKFVRTNDECTHDAILATKD